MTFSATVTKLADGPRNVVYRLTGKSDGTGQENGVRKVDITTLSKITPTQPALNLAIMRIKGTVQGGSVELLWDAPTPVRFAELSGQIQLNHSRFGGENSENVVGRTGNILLSTVNFVAGSVYDLTVELKKKT